MVQPPDHIKVSPLTANVSKQFMGQSSLYVHSLGLRLRFPFYLCIMGYSQENKMAAAQR